MPSPLYAASRPSLNNLLNLDETSRRVKLYLSDGNAIMAFLWLQPTMSFLARNVIVCEP